MDHFPWSAAKKDLQSCPNHIFSFEEKQTTAARNPLVLNLAMQRQVDGSATRQRCRDGGFVSPATRGERRQQGTSHSHCRG
jgi:hypothetical protein